MTHKILAAGSVALMGAGSLLGASAAQAYTEADCGAQPDSALTSLVGDDICQVTYYIPGEFTWDVPSGVDQIAAIVIGGGAGSSAGVVGYGGGAGEVEFYNNVVLQGEDSVSVTVGSGGDSAVGGWGDDGEDSVLSDAGNTVVASGGHGDGTSGSGYSSTTAAGRADTYGGGAKNGATDQGPGEGFLTSETGFAPASDLFPENVDSMVLGQGGSGVSVPTEGGYGWGGSSNGTSDLEDGYDGAVIFRWFIPEAASTPLASTGVDAAPMGIAAAGMLVAGGVGLAIARRARRSK